MNYQPVFASILMADASDGSGSPYAVRMLGEDARTMAYLRRRALEHAQVDTRLIVMGCHAEEILYGEADDGWTPVMNTNWQSGHVAGARAAMQSLPLRDGFFLSCCDTTDALGLEQVFQPLVDCYLNERLSLARIIVPTRDGNDLWPWLIDIGFRQPFVDLADDAELTKVLELHADQVRRVALDA